MLNAPLYNGVGGRDFTFFPDDRDERAQDSVFVRELTDRDGRPVELYERVDTPPLWWLRWPLSRGALYTHLREEDGEKRAETTARNISVKENENGLPTVLAYPPMALDMTKVRDFGEEATFYSEARGTDWSITLRRPAAMSKGDRYMASERNTGGLAVIQVGLGSDVEALIVAERNPSEARAMANMIEESFAERR
jgi:hypothetical protein